MQSSVCYCCTRNVHFIRLSKLISFTCWWVSWHCWIHFRSTQQWFRAWYNVSASLINSQWQQFSHATAIRSTTKCRCLDLQQILEGIFEWLNSHCKSRFASIKHCGWGIFWNCSSDCSQASPLEDGWFWLHKPSENLQSIEKRQLSQSYLQCPIDEPAGRPYTPYTIWAFAMLSRR